MRHLLSAADLDAGEATALLDTSDQLELLRHPVMIPHGPGC